MELKATAPILGSGVTIYDPLRYWGFTQPGKRAVVGIVGLGAMGQMGLQIAVALGHDVVAISHSAAKEQLAKDAGAKYFVNSTNNASMAKMGGMCDIILNTLAVDHEVSTYVPLLATRGRIVQLGICLKKQELDSVQLMSSK